MNVLTTAEAVEATRAQGFGADTEALLAGWLEAGWVQAGRDDAGGLAWRVTELGAEHIGDVIAGTAP